MTSRGAACLALCSGVLLALSFPRAGHPAVAWIALAPLFVALAGMPRHGALPRAQPPLRAFALGLTTGAVAFAGTISWTATVGATFGGLPAPAAAGAMLLLVAYLALYPALAALCTASFVRVLGAGGLLLAPAAWVAFEYLRGTLFGGFPWVPLGSSQAAVLPIVQLASIAGVYGLSAIVAGTSAVLAYALYVSRRRQIAAVAALAVLLAGSSAWGAWRVGAGVLTREGTAMRVGLVQANIAQADKWDPREARRILTTHVSVSRVVAAGGAELVIWPESSTPFRFGEDPAGQAMISSLAREIGVPLLVGSDVRDPADPRRLYNAAWLIGPDGEPAAVYRKQQLVPFGEFVPFGRLLFFVAPLVEAGGTFVPGDTMVLLPVGPHLVSAAICYEAVYPALAREAVAAGSTLLTTITNDAWYGRSSAPHQHFALASLRAVEQGRYLVRAANTGISGIVDPYGRVVQASALFEQAAIVGDVRLLHGRTIYSRTGDVVAHMAAALTALLVVVSVRFPDRRVP